MNLSRQSYVLVAGLGCLFSFFLSLALWTAHTQISDAKMRLGLLDIKEGADIALRTGLSATCADPGYFSYESQKPTENTGSYGLRKFCHQWQISKVFVESPLPLFTTIANLLVFFGIALEAIPRHRPGWSEERYAPLRAAIEGIGLVMLLAGILIEVALGMAVHGNWADSFSIAWHASWVGSKWLLWLLWLAAALLWIVAICRIANASRCATKPARADR